MYSKSKTGFIVSFICALLMLFGAIFSTTVSASALGGTESINFDFKLKNTSSPYTNYKRLSQPGYVWSGVDFLTGETVTPMFTIDLRGYTGTSLETLNIIISFPSKYLNENNNGLIDVSPTPITGTTPIVNDYITTGGGMANVHYVASNVQTSQLFGAPINIRLRPNLTPDGYELPITVKVTKPSGEILIPERTIKTVWHTIPFKFDQYIFETTGNFVDRNPVVNGGKAENGQLVANLDQLNDISFAFSSTPLFTQSGMGTRLIKQVKITDYLPRDAVFSPMNEAGGWTYDAATHTATFIKNFPNGEIFHNGTVMTDYTQIQAPRLKLRFPNAKVSIAYNSSTYQNNRAVMEYSVYRPGEGERSFSGESNLTFLLESRYREPGFQKVGSYLFDSLVSKSRNLEYGIHVINQESTAAYTNLEIIDRDPDPRLRFTAVKIENSSLTEGTAKLIAITDSGETVISSDVQLNKTALYPIDEALSPSVKRVILRFNEDGKILAGGRMSVKPIFLLRDPASVHFDPLNNHDFGNTFCERYKTHNCMLNYADLSYQLDSVGPQVRATAVGSYHLGSYSPKMILKKTVSADSALLGNTVRYMLELSSNWQLTGGTDEVKNIKIVDFLPQGLEYVENSMSVDWNYNGTGILNSGITDLGKMEIVPNYKQSGQTAFIWSRTDSLRAPVIRISFEVKVTEMTAEGANPNHAYAIWDNNGSNPDSKQVQIGIEGVSVEDSLDLDDDGNKTEQLAQAVASFRFDPPISVMVAELVKGNLDQSFSFKGFQEPGKQGYYQITSRNHTQLSLKNYSALTVLPYVGNENLIPDKDGQYYNLGTTFPVTITGPAEWDGDPTIASKFTFLYTEEKPNRNAAEYMKSTSWVENPSDWSKVIGVKMVLKDGQSFEDRESASFKLPMLVNFDPNLQRDRDVAWATVAQSINNIDILEGRSISLHPMSYVVRGTVWIDENRNGLIDEATAVNKLKGIKVVLLDEANQPVSDPLGKTPTILTDANGNYRLDVYREGKYKIAFFGTDDRDTLTALGDVNDNLASHSLAEQLTVTVNGIPLKGYATAPFTLSMKNPDLFRNSGLLKPVKESEKPKTTMTIATTDSGLGRTEIKLNNTVPSGDRQKTDAAKAGGGVSSALPRTGELKSRVDSMLLLITLGLSLGILFLKKREN